jgi:hypothetical protein
MQNANDDERSGWQRQHGHNDQDIIRPQRSESKSRCGERQENVLKAKPETRTWKVFVHDPISHSAPISPPRNAHKFGAVFAAARPVNQLDALRNKPCVFLVFRAAARDHSAGGIARWMVVE